MKPGHHLYVGCMGSAPVEQRPGHFTDQGPRRLRTATKPDPVAELIGRYVPEGGLVVDPFTGVGSFGVAALSAGRRFIGAELDEERRNAAAHRLDEIEPAEASS